VDNFYNIKEMRKNKDKHEIPNPKRRADPAGDL
jgi:hypothetical protein